MRAWLPILRTAAADAYANRRSFWTQVVFMFVNDITWVLFYGVLFGKAGSIRGWSFQDVMVLFSCVTFGVGLGMGLLANTRHLGRLIAGGDLDEALMLPISPLGFTLLRRINPSNLGDSVFGLALFLAFCNPTPAKLLAFLAASTLAGVVYAGFLTTLGSLTFFFGGSGEHADLGMEAAITFSMYPSDLFGGATKVIIFTLIPAAFIGTIPADVVRSFDLQAALALVSAAAVAVFLATVTFYLGLRRYSSGSIWRRL